MSLITSATNTGLSMKQTVAPTVGSLVSAATASTKKVAVLDSFSAVQSNLAALKKNISNISSIKLNDTAAMTFTGEQLTKYADVIAKIVDTRNIAATDVSMGSLNAVLKNKKVSSIAVSDTSANISAGMSTLIANNSRIAAGGIGRTDNATATSRIVVTSTNFAKADASGGTFSKFATTLTSKVNVTGLAASEITTTGANAKIDKVAVSDTSSNLVDAVANLSNAKVGSINISKITTKSISAADYDTFKSHANYSTLVTAMKPNALMNAFAVTGVTAFADVVPGGALANDINVKSITVSSSISTLPAITSLSSKVSKIDLSGTRGSFEATGALDKMAALAAKLGKVTITDDASAATDDNKVAVAATQIRRKEVALVLAKTVGVDTKPIGVNVSGAALSDVKGLLANKQVSKADIVDTAENMLAFSHDNFSKLTTSANVTITIEDNAANVSKYHTELTAAVLKYNSSKINLSVKDTAANIGTYITDIDEVATAITNDTYSTPGPTGRIAIRQVDAQGVDDTSSLIKVDLTTYNASRDVLQYVKDTTTGMAQRHVKIDTEGVDSDASINAAIGISADMKMRQYLQDVGTAAATPGATLPTAPVFALGAGTAVAAPNPNSDNTTFGGVTRTKYSDVAAIDITLKGPAAGKLSDYAAIGIDPDLLTSGNLTSGVQINVYA